MQRPPFHTVAVLLCDRAPLFETAGPISVFGIDRSSTGAPTFDVRAIAATPGPITTTAGLEIRAARGLRSLRDAEVVIVPTWHDPAAPPPADVLRALSRAHDRGATIVGLCLGAFVLAAAGLLDGRRATTHWLHAATLATRYPTVRVDPAALFVDEGDVLTSAGTAAGLDACLHLVRTAHGASAANAIARRMVVPPQRAGGQAQFIAEPVAERDGQSGVVEVLADALTRLDGPVDVDTLAARALVSRRTFDRAVRAITGTSPHQWLLHQRVLRAQRLLEETDRRVEEIARAVGFGTAVSLRPHFRRVVGVSPQAYRSTFAGRARPD